MQNNFVMLYLKQDDYFSHDLLEVSVLKGRKENEMENNAKRFFSVVVWIGRKLEEELGCKLISSEWLG